MNSHFLNGITWGVPGIAVEHTETHAAHVFLVRTRAFKIKKDVKIFLLDFSSLAERQEVIHHEKSIRPSARKSYIGVQEREG